MLKNVIIGLLLVLVLILVATVVMSQPGWDGRQWEYLILDPTTLTIGLNTVAGDITIDRGYIELVNAQASDAAAQGQTDLERYTFYVGSLGEWGWEFADTITISGRELQLFKRQASGI